LYEKCRHNLKAQSFGGVSIINMETVKYIDGEKTLPQLSVFPDMDAYSSRSKTSDNVSNSDTFVLLTGYSDVGTNVDPELYSLDVADVFEDGVLSGDKRFTYNSLCDPGVRDKIQNLTPRDQVVTLVNRSTSCCMEEPRPGIVKDIVNHASIFYWYIISLKDL